MNIITGALYRVNGKNTKRNEVQLGEIVLQSEFKSHVFRWLWNDRSDGASLTAGGN